jgi:hypothetical protein
MIHFLSCILEKNYGNFGEAMKVRQAHESCCRRISLTILIALWGAHLDRHRDQPRVGKMKFACVL